jgi:iron complex transport system permease protein
MRARVNLWVYGVAFLLAGVGLPWFGAEVLSWAAVAGHLGGNETVEGLIFFGQRIPRVAVALLVGGALAMTGAALQVLFRNPLAEPWTLGVAGGAAVGAFLAGIIPALNVSVGPLTSTQALAMVGAGVVIALVYAFSRRPEGIATHTLLLCGITISILSGGLIMLVTYFVSPYEFLSIHRWMIGGVDVIGYRELTSLIVLLIPGLWILMSCARAYNHMALGEDMAMGHGVDVRRTQVLTFVGAGIVTAAAVAMTGPIGFVGMIIPHVVRSLSGSDHRLILPASFLLGGAVLAGCDAIARTVLAPTELPVGIITAVVGAPLFLFILLRKK